MRFITIRDFRSKSARIQKELPLEKEMVLTSNGKPVAIIASVSEKDLEETLIAIRRTRASLALALIQADSLKSGKDRIGAAEIDAEIKGVRKNRYK